MFALKETHSACEFSSQALCAILLSTDGVNVFDVRKSETNMTTWLSTSILGKAIYILLNFFFRSSTLSKGFWGNGIKTMNTVITASDRDFTGRSRDRIYCRESKKEKSFFIRRKILGVCCKLKKNSLIDQINRDFF